MIVFGMVIAKKAMIEIFDIEDNKKIELESDGSSVKIVFLLEKGK